MTGRSRARLFLTVLKRSRVPCRLDKSGALENSTGARSQSWGFDGKDDEWREKSWCGRLGVDHGSPSRLACSCRCCADGISALVPARRVGLSILLGVQRWFFCIAVGACRGSHLGGCQQ